jgi:hypothetical protein
MAYTTIPKSTDYFNTKLYTGTGSSNAQTGVGFQPDWIWLKNRSSLSNHHLVDAVRGITKELRSNLTNTEATDDQLITAFGSDGFTVGTSGSGNTNGDNYASWNWKANGAGSANTDGDINSTVSANTTSGFSIVSYTGTLSGSGNTTIGHGLGAAPKMIITKSRTAGENWGVYHTSLPANNILQLNTTSPQIDTSSEGTVTAPTSSVFTVNYRGEYGNSGQNYIAYCFADVQGYSKMGSYIGNGNATTPPFVYTGFKPAFVMTKVSSGSANSWTLSDITRDNSITGGNGIGARLLANTSAAEDTNNIWASIQKYSNGFSPQGSDGVTNASGSTYIYMAIAAEPLVSTNGNAATAR